jgi:hypothetical protein
MKDKNNEIEEYMSIDLGEAAAIHCKGFVLKEVKEINRNGKMAFIFYEKTTGEDYIEPYLSDIKSLTKIYWNEEGGLMVNAKKYFESISEIKCKIFEAKGRKNKIIF